MLLQEQVSYIVSENRDAMLSHIGKGGASTEGSAWTGHDQFPCGIWLRFRLLPPVVPDGRKCYYGLLRNRYPMQCDTLKVSASDLGFSDTPMRSRKCSQERRNRTLH